MRKEYKLIFYSIGIFILSTLLITIWYVLDFGAQEEEITFSALTNVIIRIGTYGALMLTILFIIGYLIFKIRNRWILGLCLLILIIVAFFALGWFLWYTGINSLAHDPFSK